MIVLGKFLPLRNMTPPKAKELWQPMIEGVSLSDSIKVGAPNVIETNLVALIDTGADYCAIDQRLADKHSTLVKYVEHQTQYGAFGSADTAIYNLQILVSDITLQTFAATVEFRSRGMLIDLVLGMDAIRHFDLNVNRTEELVHLTWIG